MDKREFPSLQTTVSNDDHRLLQNRDVIMTFSEIIKYLAEKKSRETVVLCPSEQWLVVTEVETQTSIKVGGDFMDTESRRLMKHYLPYTSIPFKEIHLIKHP